MDSSTAKTVSETSPLQKVLGVFLILAGSAFLYASNNMINGFPSGDDADFDRVTQAVQLFQSVIALAFVAVGIFVFAAKRDIIYDEDTVEYRTTIFGKSWSRKLDRSLVRDLGNSFSSRSYDRNRRDRFR